MARTWPGMSSPIMSATVGLMPNETCAAVRSDRAICHANIRVSCTRRSHRSDGSQFVESGSCRLDAGASIAWRHHVSSAKFKSRITNGRNAARFRASGPNWAQRSRLADTSGESLPASAAATPASSSRQCSFSWCTRSSDWLLFQHGAVAEIASCEVSSNSLTRFSVFSQGERHSYCVIVRMLRWESGLFTAISGNQDKRSKFMAGG